MQNQQVDSPQNATVSQHVIDTVKYAQENSPFYRQKLALISVTPENWSQIPFTHKDELAMDNDSFCAVPRSKVADHVTTSGTTGDPVTIFLTKDDLSRLGQNEKHSLEITGVRPGDLLQLMTTIDRQFMAGLAYYLGTQALDCGIVRIGPGIPELQWRSIQKYKPRYLIAVPSFLITLINYAKTNGIDFNETSVEGVICIGEAIRNDDLSANVLATRITQDWNIKLYSTYASTEMATAFTECEAGEGGHLNAELLHLEVIKEDGSYANHGEEGEVVVTPIGVTGTPLVRYRTGDIARIYTEPCKCGRKTPRLGPIIGRKNQMIKYKGTTLYPQAIFDLLESVQEIVCYKVHVKKDELGKDVLTVILDQKLANSALIEELRLMCNARLRVVPEFSYMELDKLRSMVFKHTLRKPEKITFE